MRWRHEHRWVPYTEIGHDWYRCSVRGCHETQIMPAAPGPCSLAPCSLTRELRLNVATNAAGYAMFAGDGRETFETGRGPTIRTTPEETERAKVVAQRVLDHIDTHDGRL